MNNLQERFRWAVEILEDNMDRMDNEERTSYIYDVVNHGCISGCVSGVIYYHETEKLFKEDMNEVLQFIQDIVEEHGINVLENIEFFKLPNDAVWLVVEEVAHEMLNNMHEEQY